MTTRRATLRFFADLADLASADRNGEVEVTFDVARSVKDAVESRGVPHTEVALLLVDGSSVGFDRLLVGGEHVGVYPHFSALPVGEVSWVMPPALPAARFVADVNLGRLAGRLRALGFDTLYRNDYDDAEVVADAAEERRWVLSRDRGLLMRAAVTHGCLVRSDDPREQTTEVVRRLDLADAIRPRTRCIPCNGVLAPAGADEVAGLVGPRTRRDHDRFSRCQECGRVYWAGSHTTGLDGFVSHVRARVGGA